MPAFGYLPIEPDAVTCGRAAADRSLLPGAEGPVSTRAWMLDGCGRAERIGPVLNNLPTVAVHDAVTEYAARALHLGGKRRLVVAVQRFIMPEVTMVARADPGGESVRLRGCWGIAEDLGDAPSFDHWLLEGSELLLRECSPAPKLTATAAAATGTRRVAVRPAYRVRSVLSGEAVRLIGRRALDIARVVGRPVELEVAVRADRSWLVDCSPR
ncbi:hypothetical protein ACFQZ2_04935 [Streptomonospora algeriensis]|uniref:Uncharacterized protein n=1 Tax=Streptomonospora algeriensis TaxID=995084 RepID=A0ABW3BBN3_9ACTN